MFYFLGLIFALSPTYLVRFKFGPLGLNLLEILVAVFLAGFIIWIQQKNRIADFKEFILTRSRKFVIASGLFLLAGLISALVSPVHARALGLFIVYFLEPILLFFAVAYIFQDPSNKERFLKLILIVIGIFSVYGIQQYFTLWGLPYRYLGNTVEPKRIVSFFLQPNSFALFLGPLLAFTMPFLKEPHFKKVWVWLCWIAGATAIVLTSSRGGWIALLCAIIFYAIFSRDNKIKISIAAIVVVLAAIVYIQPVLRYRIITAVRGDASTRSRASYASVAGKMIKASPIFGQGLYGFATNFPKFNSNSELPPINLAHNIFLNLWVETGLLGLLSFILLNVWVFKKSFKNRVLPYAFGLCLFLVTFWIHGLADNPYFLNALALEYWMILALGL